MPAIPGFQPTVILTGVFALYFRAQESYLPAFSDHLSRGRHAGTNLSRTGRIRGRLPGCGFHESAVRHYAATEVSIERKIREMRYAMVGFLTQHSAELPGQPSIMNNYGLTAFITSGFLAGLAYWLFSGRGAGGPGVMVAPPSNSDHTPTVVRGPAPGNGKPTKA